MSTEKGYSTSDIYVAAALALLTGIMPAYSLVNDFKRVYVNLSWPDREQLRPYIDDIKGLTVNVQEFKEIHYQIKTKCLSIVKERTA